ncbi:CHAT domain-containing protein [Nesterenkonia suensis]
MLSRIGPGPVPDDLVTVAGRARVTLALTRFETGHREEAFSLLDEADQLADSPGGSAVRVLAAIQRAGLQGRLGDWAASLATMESLGDSAVEVSPRAAAVVALNAGLARQFLGDVAGSAADLDRAERLASRHGIDDVAAAALHNRGRLEFVRGHLSRALELMGQARELAGVRAAQADLDRARVLLEAGLLDAAGDLLATCEAIAEDENLVHDLGEITMEFARLAMLQGDYPLARRRAERARQIFVEHDESAWRTQAELLATEADLSTELPSDEIARRASVLADGPAEASGVGTTAALLAAEAHARSGALEEARRRLAAVRARRLSLPDSLHRHLVRVMIAAAEGDAATVRGSVLAGVATLGREQGRRSGLDTRTAMALHGRRLQALDIDLAMESGSPAKIFDACERWRGVSHRLPNVTPVADSELAQLLTRLRQARLALREDRGPAEALRDQIERLEEHIQRRDWGTDAPDVPADEWTMAPAIDVTAIRRRLVARHSTGLMSLFVHRDRLRAVTVTCEGAWLTDLAAVDDVTGLMRRLTADLRDLGRATDPRLRSAIRRAVDAALADLGRVLAPASPSTARVVVLPTRLLASLPWGMLPQLSGRVVTVAPSATFWAGPAGRTDQTDQTDQTVPVGQERPGVEPLQVAAMAGPGLCRATEEVEAVGRAWPRGRTMIDQEADGAAMIEALQRSRLVHVAAHGTHHEQSPLFSSILLADGPVFAHELQSSGIGARHIVLSACDVGRAVIRPGEEPLGLTAALLACGVDSVIAAVAPVRDETSAEAMVAYHRQLARGTDAAAALAEIGEAHPESRLFCAYGRDWSALPG